MEYMVMKNPSNIKSAAVSCAETRMQIVFHEIWWKYVGLRLYRIPKKV